MEPSTARASGHAAFCITGFEHAFSEIEANIRHAIGTLAAGRRPFIFGVLPRNAS